MVVAVVGHMLLSDMLLLKVVKILKLLINILLEMELANLMLLMLVLKSMVINQFLRLKLKFNLF